MIQSSLSQLFILLYAMLAGAVCGAAAAMLKGFREELRLPTAAAMAMDLLMCVFSGVLIVWFSLRFGDGAVRGYQLLASVCGACLYCLCLGRLTEKGGRLAAKLLRLVLSPVAFVIRGFGLYIEKIYKNLSSAALKVKNGFSRSTSAGKIRKKIQKNYKKML